MKTRYIVHADMDAFFAAVEQRDNPSFRGKPVVIGADPKQGLGRGVVSTCSYEARKYGIHSAMPISIAFRKCPHAIFLPGNHKKYSDVSHQIFKILSAFTPAIEPVSIDEVFLDISDTYQLFGTPIEACLLMKQRVKKETGLTVSIGLAPTKMAAKIASGFKKPDGLTEVKKEKLLDFLWPLDVERLWGVGKKTKELINSIGIYTIGELAQRKKEELIGLLGKNGSWLWDMGQGIDTSEVLTEHETKSISQEITFEKDTSDKKYIERELAWLCEQVCGSLRKEGFKSRTLTLKIRLEGFQTYTRSKTLKKATNFSEDMIKIVRELYENFEIKNKRVRLIGARASGLITSEEPTLFEDKTKAKKENIHSAIDKIKQKFGVESIRRASSR